MGTIFPLRACIHHIPKHGHRTIHVGLLQNTHCHMLYINHLNITLFYFMYLKRKKRKREGCISRGGWGENCHMLYINHLNILCIKKKKKYGGGGGGQGNPSMGHEKQKESEGGEGQGARREKRKKEGGRRVGERDIQKEERWGEHECTEEGCHKET